MHKRPFGKTGMEITPLGVGAWAIGGSGWGPQDDQESIEAIQRAVELGINWIDTAAVYGQGHSEEVVGKALKGLGEKPYVFTKCSLVWNDKGDVTNSLKADSLRREIEASLRRLNVDTIDLYQIHWPNPDPDIEEGWSTLNKFKQEGKVRAIGVSNFSVEQMERARKIAPVETLQPPYSLIHRDIEQDILPYCKEHNTGVIVYSPMASGLLSGTMTQARVQKMSDDDWRRQAPDFQEPRLSRHLKLAELLTEIGYPHDVPAGAVAIAWTLRDPVVTGAIVGVRRPSQIENLLPAAEFRLSQTEIQTIEKYLQENP